MAERVFVVAILKRPKHPLPNPLIVISVVRRFLLYGRQLLIPSLQANHDRKYKFVSCTAIVIGII